MPCLPSSLRNIVAKRPIVLCLCVLFASVGGVEAQSPVELPDAAPVEEPKLGGEATVSPSLVPHSILSDEEVPLEQQGPPSREVPEQPDETAQPDEAVQPKEAASDNTSAKRAEPTPDRVARTPRREIPSQVEEPPAASPAREFTPEELSTRERVRRTLQAFEGWRLNSRDHSPWEVMHAVIGHGISTQLLEGGPSGRPVTAVGWLCYNRPAAGLRIFYLSGNDIGTMQGPGVEGHRGQLMAILAQIRVKSDYPLQINSRSLTLADLIEYEKRTCYAGSELTFKLIGLNHYLDQDARWTNDQGERWDIPRLIREEISQPIRGATCGGTHRLSGLSLAVRKRILNDRPLDGEYARAAKYIRDYHAYTFSLQNRDGSLSTEWFRGRGTDPSPDRRLQTTGHILEWLCYSLPDSEIRGPRPRAAVDYLANLMWQHRNRTWEVGPLGHAIHALALYDERVFQPHNDFERWQSASLPNEESEADATASK